MIDFEPLFTPSCYSLSQSYKGSIFIPLLNQVIAHHRTNCEYYDKLLSSYKLSADYYYKNIEEVPYIAVQLFKKFNLHSLNNHTPFKVMQSSGTTSSVTSQISLDQNTAKLQSRALVNVIKSYAGNKRLPMIIIDKASTVKNKNTFSARTAGIRGMSVFGRNHVFVLNEDMSLNKDALLTFLKEFNGQKILIFGFTFMIWKYLYLAVKSNEIKFNNALLVHSGGWKQLENISVNNETFKYNLNIKFNIKKIHNFYGMVEQVGSIYMECEFGNLHAPLFSDIIIRDFKTGHPCEIGHEGQIQVLSLLPLSYPGNSILTEDIGILRGEDDCACKRKGRYFHVLGRIPKAEARGCSDTHAQEVVAI